MWSLNSSPFVNSSSEHLPVHSSVHTPIPTVRNPHRDFPCPASPSAPHARSRVGASANFSPRGSGVRLRPCAGGVHLLRLVREVAALDIHGRGRGPLRKLRPHQRLRPRLVRQVDRSSIPSSRWITSGLYGERTDSPPGLSPFGPRAVRPTVMKPAPAAAGPTPPELPFRPRTDTSSVLSALQHVLAHVARKGEASRATAQPPR